MTRAFPFLFYASRNPPDNANVQQHKELFRNSILTFRGIASAWTSGLIAISSFYADEDINMDKVAHS
jgi:hypothetical protein